jgi:hypothetical protein
MEIQFMVCFDPGDASRQTLYFDPTQASVENHSLISDSHVRPPILLFLPCSVISIPAEGGGPCHGLEG